MSFVRLAHLSKIRSKIGIILLAALLVSGTPHVNDETILLDRGLPSENINIEPDPDRSNIRWSSGNRNERFSGDDFVIGEAGERYAIDHIRTWAVLGYREAGPSEPYAVGDWFNQIRLLGGSVSDSQLAVRTSGEIALGSKSTSNPDIRITRVTYPNARESNYFNFESTTIPIWQIDFYNLNWLVEGGQRYNFSVQGIGRQFFDTDYSHVWYNHASNAALSGTPQQGADGLLSAFENTGEFLSIVDLEREWNKPADLNIQVFGRALPGVAETLEQSDTISLVEIVRNLNEAGFLTDRTYNRTLREVEQGIVKLRSQILYKLIQQDVFSDQGTFVERDIFGSVLRDPDIDNQLDGQHLFAQLNRDLDKLNNTGILTQSVYEQIQGEIASGNLFHTLSIYRMAASLIESEEAVAPDLLKPQLNELKAAGILSEQGYTSLLNDLYSAELQNPIEFLNYFERAQMFDLTEYSLEPEIYFPEIYQSVAQMLSQEGVISGEMGEFDLELILDEEFQLIVAQLYELTQETRSNLSEDDTNELRTYDAVVSVQVDGRQYEQSSFYSPPIHEQEFIGYIESDGLVNLFNKILRDQQSSYRLFSVSSFAPHLDDSRFGVIALTKAQAGTYWKGTWYNTGYDNELTSDRIAEIITQLSELQLLEHLSEAEILAAEQNIARNYITHPHQLLSAFKDVVLPFDWEGAGGETPYAYLLESLAAISHGHFNPTDIDDGFDWNTETASLAFTLNGKRYSTDLEFESDWFDPEFFEFVTSVVTEEVPQGQFYPLSESGDKYDVEEYIFLTDRQLATLQAQQFITIAKE